MKAIEKELDRMVQELHKNQRCHICGAYSATEIHHDKGLNVFEYIPKEQAQYLMQVKNESYKDFLTFEMQMTEDEWLKQCKETLRRVM